MRRSFTLIELIFVLVLLGILAAVALPKFGETLEQTNIAKAKSTVAAIRSGLQVYKNIHILRGEEPYPATLDSDSSHLFGKVLPHPITPSTKVGGWSKEDGKYIFHTTKGKIAFEYDSTNGSFTCIKGSPTTIAGVCSNF